MNIIDVYTKFPTEKDCIEHLEKIRWSEKVICPYCKSEKVTSLSAEMRHHCNNCKTSFSVTVATIFHHTHLPLQKWFFALNLILNGGHISSRKLAREIEVNKNTACLILRRVKEAMVEQKYLFCRIIGA